MALVREISYRWPPAGPFYRGQRAFLLPPLLLLFVKGAVSCQPPWPLPLPLPPPPLPVTLKTNATSVTTHYGHHHHNHIPRRRCININTTTTFTTAIPLPHTIYYHYRCYCYLLNGDCVSRTCLFVCRDCVNQAGSDARKPTKLPSDSFTEKKWPH